MGENHFAPVPAAAYGGVLAMCGISYLFLSLALVRLNGRDSTLGRALGRDLKGKVSLALYAAAIPMAFVNQWISIGLYVVVALMWFIPDRRIEKAMRDRE